MSVTPEKNPNYIYAHPYATLIADEYRMRGGYCIVRPGGTDDHLMLLTRAGRGLFRTPRGDAVPLAAGSLAVIPPSDGLRPLFIGQTSLALPRVKAKCNLIRGKLRRARSNAPQRFEASSWASCTEHTERTSAFRRATRHAAPS